LQLQDVLIIYMQMYSIKRSFMFVLYDPSQNAVSPFSAGNTPNYGIVKLLCYFNFPQVE